MITLTTEQAQQIEETLESCEMGNWYATYNEMYVEEALATIRAARAQEQAEQPVSQEYQDHLVNQSFDWAAMAAKHQLMEGYQIGLAEMREKCAELCESYNWSSNGCAAAIRAIKFEGDIGFRPVSEMIAEHKQDPKKAAAIEKAKMRKAEQEPVSDYFDFGLEEVEDYLRNCCNSPFMADKLSEIRKSILEPFAYAFSKNETWLFSLFKQPDSIPLYSHPVRTKDLTDEELNEVIETWATAYMNLNPDTAPDPDIYVARAVIAADREKNK